MMNAVQQATGAEGVCDALANILLSYEFAEVMVEEYARQSRVIPYRRIEAVYTEDMETLDAYPAIELIATAERTEADSPKVQIEISAQVTVNGSIEQDMGREAKRIVRSIRSLFRKRPTLDPYFGGSPVWTGDIDYGPIVRARTVIEGRNYLKSASIALFINAYSE